MMEKKLLNIMETSEGRIFVWKLLEGTGVDAGNFNPEPCRNAWLAGRASLGVELLNILRNTERGTELEYIMRMEARQPPAEPAQEDFYDQFKEGDD